VFAAIFRVVRVDFCEANSMPVAAVLSNVYSAGVLALIPTSARA